MLFYYIIFFIIASCAFLEVFGLKERDKRIIFTFICLVLYILSFVRWECGTDWRSYYFYFSHIPENTLIHESNFEFGYAFINAFAKVYWGDFTGVLFLCATILFSFQSIAIWKLSPLPILSVLFFFSIFIGGIFFVRQTIAGGILLYSILYIQKRRFFSFLFLVVLASLFHRSAVLFIFAFFDR